eukprot:g571.t1
MACSSVASGARITTGPGRLFTLRTFATATTTPGLQHLRASPTTDTADILTRVQDAAARALWSPRSVDFLVWRQQLPDKIQSNNYLAPSTLGPGAGDGVFAGRDYKRGEPVEINPFFRILDKNVPKEFDAYKFDDFTFNGGDGFIQNVDEDLCAAGPENEHAEVVGGGDLGLRPTPRPRIVNDHSLVIMGFGSYMNHMGKTSGKQNVESGYFVRRFALFKAIRDIQEGEELFINYGKNYDYSRFLADGNGTEKGAGGVW